MPLYSTKNAFAKSNDPLPVFTRPNDCVCAIKSSHLRFCPVVIVLAVASMPAKTEEENISFRPSSFKGS